MITPLSDCESVWLRESALQDIEGPCPVTGVSFSPLVMAAHSLVLFVVFVSRIAELSSASKVANINVG